MIKRLLSNRKEKLRKKWNCHRIQEENQAEREIEIESEKKEKEQVTRGHNIVADGWAGASNPQPHPNPTLNSPPTHTQTQCNNCSIMNARFSHFQLERDGRTDGRTDKASYRVGCPQLKTTKLISSKTIQHYLMGCKGGLLGM